MAPSFPTHLNCAYCPSQTYPDLTTYKLEGYEVLVRKYECFGGHVTFIGEEKAREPEPMVEGAE